MLVVKNKLKIKFLEIDMLYSFFVLSISFQVVVYPIESYPLSCSLRQFRQDLNDFSPTGLWIITHLWMVSRHSILLISLLIGLLVFNFILSLASMLGTTPAIQKDPQDGAAIAIDIILQVISWFIAFYFIYIVVKMRYDVAAANGIKTSAADCLIAWCCSCCSIIPC